MGGGGGYGGVVKGIYVEEKGEFRKMAKGGLSRPKLCSWRYGTAVQLDVLVAGLIGLDSHCPVWLSICANKCDGNLAN